MEIKHNIRQRRQNRIRSLIEQKPGLSYPSNTRAMLRERGSELNQPVLPGVLREGEQELHNDPEWVWKQGETNRWKDTLQSFTVKEEEQWREWMKRPSRKQSQVKLLICLALFAGVWGWFQLEQPWADNGKQVVKQALNEPFQFGLVASWYDEAFAGAPSWIPIFGDQGISGTARVSTNVQSLYVPVKGQIVQAYAATLTNIGIEVAPRTPISAVDTGRVIFSGDTPKQGITIIIQHANGLQSIYGQLSKAEVTVNDWIEGGERIGLTAESAEDQLAVVYFALKKDKNYIDPTDVIPFD